MVKLVVADLDGTLLNENHQVSDFTCQQAKKLTESGIPFMIATGRHYQDVYLIAQRLNVEMYLITSNGARIHNKTGECIYQDDIPESAIQKILDISANFEAHRNVYLEDLWLVEEESQQLLEMHKDSGFGYQISDFNNLQSNGIVKFYFSAPHDKLVPLEQKLLEHLGNQLHITFTTPNYLEVMRKGVSKGNALKKVLQEKGIEAKDVMAFGDGLNDTEMLQLVGHPVIMENATPELKKRIPNAHIAPMNSEDGVIHHLKKTGILN